MKPVQKTGIKLTPTQAIVLAWLAAILLGTVVLMLPASQLKPVSFLDVLFTSASAMCVTGLMTVNVAESFTTFGQIVILFIIQLGGIGIMTAGTFVMVLIGEKISLSDWSLIRSSYTHLKQLNIKHLTREIIIMVLILEAMGTVVLTALWTPDIGFKNALYAGLFHSVSAFCNAGISTFPEGLNGMEKKFAADLTFTILIVLGGIGFMTIRDLTSLARPSNTGRRRVSLQTKIILIFSFCLIAAGALCFFTFEFNHALSERPVHERLMASLFHSVSARTAGFANVNISELNNPTVYALLLLMFVGGAPGSTAGGVKITTIAIIGAIALSRYRGHEKTHVFKKSVPETTVSRAIAIISFAILAVVIFAFLLLITESQSIFMLSDDRGQFLKIIFEAVSALGTVGLSLGITPDLSVPGKLLIIALMLIGRLGPLTVIMAISKPMPHASYQFSEEDIMVG